MLDEQDIRAAICEVGRRVWTKNFVASNDGNISFRLSDDRVLCSPTQISKGFMKPEDIVIVDMDGNQMAGRRKATSEVKIHLFIYRNRPDVYSVVHVHPPHATAFAVAHRELPKCILPEVEVFLGEIPMAPYETTGTWEFAHTIAPWVRNHDAFLLTNHGAVTVGQDPYDAYYKMETLDQYSRILLLAKQLGDWKSIGQRGIDELLSLKARYGIADPRDCEPCGNGFRASSQFDPAEPFRPHPGPLDDSPKLGPLFPTLPPNNPPSQHHDDAEIRRVVEEVVRRLL